MKMKSFLLLCLVILGIASVGLMYLYPSISAKSQTESMDIGHGVTMEFVLIHPGSFTMGSSLHTGVGDEAPEHRVTITKPFYMGTYEVTQEQWQNSWGTIRVHSKGIKHP